jgi:hypothetical protein
MMAILLEHIILALFSEMEVTVFRVRNRLWRVYSPSEFVGHFCEILLVAVTTIANELICLLLSFWLLSTAESSTEVDCIKAQIKSSSATATTVGVSIVCTTRFYLAAQTK